ncbi:hypothetical protein MOQ72_36115 [Saccharopolyspora sp. K220]|uniref:hypothetical protein n=1 Tax=Saccharopolyspora soli TaxID=2926618 RepID=UPI001F5A6B7D|nr:hypothetical protein [Saccharopolyspora soli]MCI2422865.1 hypothetical protein [Saccharopolyspora soli]
MFRVAACGHDQAQHHHSVGRESNPADVLAEEEGISISGLITVQLKKLTAAKLRYREAKQEALEATSEAASRGGSTPTWTREELYDR